MKRVVMLIIAAALVTGCATTQQKRRATTAPAQAGAAHSLDRAVEMLGAGDTAGATRILNVIVSGRPVPGVTDEALFRLALLSLKPTPERPATRQGRLLLKRLHREYPNSSWTAQAAPLVQLIGSADELRRQSHSHHGGDSTEELRRQNKSLKTANEELTRQVNELNLNLEKLKHLDLELEQKNR